MDWSGYRGNPFSPPAPGGQRRRGTRRDEANAWAHSASDWLPVPNFGAYFPASLHPRVFEEYRRQFPPINIPPPDSGPSPSPRLAFPVGMTSHSAKDGTRAPRLGCGSAESALRELHNQLSIARAIFNGLHATWDQETANIRYAKRESLRRLWQDRVQKKTEDAAERKRMREIGDKISRCIQQARNAVESDNFLDIPAGPYIADRRKRVVRKIGVSCDAIVELADKALLDPVACQMLLKELEEVMAAVDPTMEELYGRQPGATATQTNAVQGDEQENSPSNGKNSWEDGQHS